MAATTSTPLLSADEYIACFVDGGERPAWEYFPDDPEPRRVDDTLNAGPIQLELVDVFRRV